MSRLPDGRGRDRHLSTPTLVLSLVLPLVLSLVPACRERAVPTAAAPGAAPSPADGDKVTRQSKSGPVTATITAWPARPTLGDPIHVELVVAAEGGIEVTMPAFGDALGRFPIVDFTPRQQLTASGGSISSQRYTLEAPMSGPQKIPRLLIEFSDHRPGQAQTGARSPSGSPTTTAAPEVSELETEELTIEVQSPAPAGAITDELRPPRGRLPELTEHRSLVRRLMPWGIGLLAAVIAATILMVVTRARRVRARESAYDAAMARLRSLEARGAPAAAEADAWYVELSGIVRRYLEDRFGVRAPELTTEEFLREISNADLLSHAHKVMLGEFLERCDRVKFAAYRPREGESREALAAARRFVEETRPAEADEAGPRAPRAVGGAA